MVGGTQGVGRVEVMRVLDGFLIAGGLTLVSLAGLDTLTKLAVDERPPIAITSVEALNSPVEQGGSLVVRIRREKTREDCPLTSIRWATDMDGRKHLLPSISVDVKGGPVGTDYVDVTYPLGNLEPGQWILSVRLAYRCPAADFIIDHPPLPFRVAELDAPGP